VIETEAKIRGLPVETVRESYLSQNSMHTFIGVDEIASMVAYLASPAGRRISGQEIAIDGNAETLR
jgi:NAD(P)-dependent dehydrogenase (short-subunit alcohol dehydrogenase family)